MFNGGTALSKLYFPRWRFSEDLDFGVEGQYKGSEDDLHGSDEENVDAIMSEVAALKDPILDC
nr:nucleotidyl transferase AbiEii/AbiGii toxin family protein [Halorussus salinisoli]